MVSPFDLYNKLGFHHQKETYWCQLFQNMSKGHQNIIKEVPKILLLQNEGLKWRFLQGFSSSFALILAQFKRQHSYFLMIFKAKQVISQPLSCLSNLIDRSSSSSSDTTTDITHHSCTTAKTTLCYWKCNKSNKKTITHRRNQKGHAEMKKPTKTECTNQGGRTLMKKTTKIMRYIL